MKTSTILGAAVVFAVGFTIGRYAGKRQAEFINMTLRELKAKLDNLVAAEDFENAAIVRDLIRQKSKAA